MNALNLVTVRASALSDFLDCPARAEAKHLRKLKSASSAAALLGTAVHKSTAVFDQSKLDNAGITIEESAAAAVDAIHKPNEDVEFGEDESPQQTESIAVALHRKYCKEIAPLQVYKAVEVTCNRLELPDIGLALTGTTDRVRVTRDELGTVGYGITDVKTGKAAVKADGTVETKGHRYQIGVYEILAQFASGLPITMPGQIVGLQVAKTDKGQRAARSEPINFARDVLIGDADSPGVLEIVAKMIHSGNFPGNPRSMLCGAKYCPIYNTCKFRK